MTLPPSDEADEPHDSPDDAARQDQRAEVQRLARAVQERYADELRRLGEGPGSGHHD